MRTTSIPLVAAATMLLLSVPFASRQAEIRLEARTLVPARQTAASAYTGADACKDCHTKIFDAWNGTKHARALSKLSASEREDRCIGCHVTGSREMITADGANPTFPNVQCEACHGPGRAHVEAAKAGNAAAAKTTPVTEETCTVCHNDTSPHYKYFLFPAMKGLSHQVR